MGTADAGFGTAVRAANKMRPQRDVEEHFIPEGNRRSPAASTRNGPKPGRIKSVRAEEWRFIVAGYAV
jgi:hypothetical protein